MKPSGTFPLSVVIAFRDHRKGYNDSSGSLQADSFPYSLKGHGSSKLAHHQRRPARSRILRQLRCLLSFSLHLLSLSIGSTNVIQSNKAITKRGRLGGCVKGSPGKCAIWIRRASESEQGPTTEVAGSSGERKFRLDIIHAELE